MSETQAPEAPGALHVERLIESLIYNLYGATLVGNPAPSVKALHDRMVNPKVGDLVLEVSSIWQEGRTGTRLGRLVKIALEPMYTAEQWYGDMEAEPEEKIPNEHVWYLTLADGREYHWTNAQFVAVPTNLLSHAYPFQSDPSAFLPET